MDDQTSSKVPFNSDGKSLFAFSEGESRYTSTPELRRKISAGRKAISVPPAPPPPPPPAHGDPSADTYQTLERNMLKIMFVMTLFAFLAMAAALLAVPLRPKEAVPAASMLCVDVTIGAVAVIDDRAGCH